MSSLGLETGVLREDLACLEESDKLRDALVVLNTLSSRYSTLFSFVEFMAPSPSYETADESLLALDREGKFSLFM
jgi:hypothetical protein